MCVCEPRQCLELLNNAETFSVFELLWEEIPKHQSIPGIHAQRNTTTSVRMIERRKHTHTEHSVQLLKEMAAREFKNVVSETISYELSTM